MKKQLVIGTLLASSIFSAASPAFADKEAAGAIIGAIIGAAGGSKIGGGNGRTAAIIVGAIAGSVIGGKLGDRMDDEDRRRCAQAQRDGLNGSLGRSDWRGRDASGSFTTVREGWYGDQRCREYVSVVTHRGMRDETRGVACVDRNGNWTETQSRYVDFSDRRPGPGRRDDYGPRPGRPDPYRPTPPPPSRAENIDRTEVRSVTRRTGGEWLRLNLRDGVDLSRLEIRVQGAGARVYQALAYGFDNRPMELRLDRRGDAFLNPGTSMSVDVRGGQITTIDINIESMGGYADVELTVASDYGYPVIQDVQRIPVR